VVESHFKVVVAIHERVGDLVVADWFDAELMHIHLILFDLPFIHRWHLHD
jgi:hypothetical protein